MAPFVYFQGLTVTVQVIAGARTEVEVLQAFLAGFDGSMGPKSAVVTPDKFLAHYNNVSASVDDDEYFELMMQNCWHLQGSDLRCRRLLVTHEDGTQSVEAVDNDYDISKEDLQVWGFLWAVRWQHMNAYGVLCTPFRDLCHHEFP